MPATTASPSGCTGRIGVLLLAEIAFGLLLDEIAPRGTPARAGVINLHKSFGIVLGVLIVVRIAWRLGHAPPPWPATMSARRQRAANLGHVALYACMVVAPLAGYLGSNFSKYGVRFFGVVARRRGAPTGRRRIRSWSASTTRAPICCSPSSSATSRWR